MFVPQGAICCHGCPHPVKGIIDAWLEQNAKTCPKQQQTAQRIYERLGDEYGFTDITGRYNDT